MPGTAVACLLLAPWPLTLLARQHPGVPVAALSEGSRRVLHANSQALALGVRPGMHETAALSRCPELHAEVVSAPTANAAWISLTETLYARYSNRIDAGHQGVVYLQVAAPAARELAAALSASAGLAGSLEVAHLAALRAKPGEVREITADTEKAYLPLSLTEHLHALDLTGEQIRGLQFLGVRGLADLMKWSAAQREAFLGVTTGRRLNRFLRGERRTVVERHVPGQILSAERRFCDPLHEPGELEAVLLEVVPELYAELRGRTAAYLTLHADTLGGRLSSTRRLKWPLQEAGIRRLAARLLLTTDALPLGLDALGLELSGLEQPSRQIGLWPGPAELDAVREVLERFPAALVRVEWRDPYAYAADARSVWVDWLTGAERPGGMTPRLRAAPVAEPEVRPQAEATPEAEARSGAEVSSGAAGRSVSLPASALPTSGR